MRQLLVATLLVVAGCAADGLPLESGNGPGPGGSAVDMAKAPDLGGAGAKCTTACDCQPGLACRQGTCGKASFGPVYCCDSNDCPSGNVCQSKTGGFAQCGGTSGGGPGGGGGGGGFPQADMLFPFDGGTGGFCKFVKCSSDSTCKQFGCGTCSASAGVCNAP